MTTYEQVKEEREARPANDPDLDSLRQHTVPSVALVLEKLSDGELEDFRVRFIPRDGDSDEWQLTMLFLMDFAIHEHNRRHDVKRDARIAANKGHLAGVGGDSREWFAYCECVGPDDDTLAVSTSREAAIAEMTAHLLEYGLGGEAVAHPCEYEEVE